MTNKNSKKVMVSWSSGKDSAWTLYQLQRMEDVEIVGLLTTINPTSKRVAMHGVRHDLVEAQARAAGVPLFAVDLPWPCSNVQYEAIMHKAISDIKEKFCPTHMAFGDLFLEDVRQYRIDKMADSGIELMFPLWLTDTRQLAREMVDAGERAIVCSVNPKQLDGKFSGRVYDHRFIDDLPDSVDPCGENGEFHSFAYKGPMFSEPIDVQVGETEERDGFVFTDISRSNS